MLKKIWGTHVVLSTIVFIIMTALSMVIESPTNSNYVVFSTIYLLSSLIWYILRVKYKYGIEKDADTDKKKQVICLDYIAEMALLTLSVSSIIYGCFFFIPNIYKFIFIFIICSITGGITLHFIVHLRSKMKDINL